MAVDYTRSSGLRVAITLSLQGIFKLDAFNDQFEFRPVQRLLFPGGAVVVETSFFESFRPKTVSAAIKIQNLDLCLASIDEDKDVTAQWIFSHHILGHRSQTRK